MSPWLVLSSMVWLGSRGLHDVALELSASAGRSTNLPLARCGLSAFSGLCWKSGPRPESEGLRRLYREASVGSSVVLFLIFRMGIRSIRVQPVLRNKRVAFSPELDDRFPKPGLWEVGMVEGDDL